MERIKGFLKKQSIQKQIQLLVILVSVLSTLILGIGSFLIFRYAIEKNYKEDFRYNLDISNNIMNIQLENIVMLSRNILTNNDIMDILEVSKNQEGKYFNSEQTHDLERTLSSMMYQDAYMAEVAVIDNSGKIYGSHKNLGATSYKRNDDILETDFIKMAKDAKGKEIFFTGNILDPEKSPYTFSMVKELRNPFGQNEMGYLVVNIRKKILDNSFVTLKGGYKSNYFFILGNDHSTAYYTGSEEEKAKIMKEYEKNSNFKNKYTFATSHNELLDWDFVSVIKKNELTGDSNFIGIAILVIILFVTVVGNILSKMVSNWIYRPLYQISEMIQEVGEGKRQLTHKFDDSEVGKIGKQFREMVNNNLELRENLLVAQVKDRESELLLLQSQINPHFLYNTLDSICCMAIIERQDQIAKMVECLSRMFRLSLNQGNKTVQLKDEVEHVRSYMEIQNFRFHDRFELILEIPEEIKSIFMLKFILQPFVENAMYHGLEPKRGKGKLKVWGEENAGFLYLYIEDDGVGMEDVSDVYKGYGVKNVIERIKLYYGNECGVVFESSPLEGTKVKIKIRAEYERREESENA